MKCFEIGDPLQVLEKLTILTVNMKCFEIYDEYIGGSYARY